MTRASFGLAGRGATRGPVGGGGCGTKAPLLRNPRAIVPPSRRIHNWHALPVEGAGPSRREWRWALAGLLAGLAVVAMMMWGQG